MMRKFVAGILYHENDEILLVRRSIHDKWNPGLWSLPGGEVEQNEGSKIALTREFLEETGLVVNVDKKLNVIERTHWLVEIYRVHSLENLSPTSNDKDILKVEFFSGQNLPEKIVFEALLALQKDLICRNKIITPNIFTRQVDRTLAALFYTYLAPSLNTWDNILHFDLIWHIIVNTPYRKFKSCIPYLLGDCYSDSLAYALIPEVLFAMWTLLDDLCDQRNFRYNNPTTLQAYGIPVSCITLFTLIESINELLSREVSSEFHIIIVKSLLLCAEGQFDRFTNTNFTSIDNYLDSSSKRSSFLGIAWQEGLNEIGKHQEANFLGELHKRTSKLGQIINDYFDLRNELRDFDDGVISYYTILLKQGISRNESDLYAFKKFWNNKNFKDEYKSLLEKYQIEKIIREQVLKEIEDIQMIILNSGLDEAKKNILVAWIKLSIKDFGESDLLSSDFSDDLNNFLESINEICYQEKI